MDSLLKSGPAETSLPRLWRTLRFLPQPLSPPAQVFRSLSARIRLKARRFRCRNPRCGRKIFVERLPEVAFRHARQTQRLADIVRLIGFVVGGLPGSRLLARLAITTSDDTLRRVKMRPQSDAIEPIRSLGVDDWAWRKGQDYGTILVDLERHRVADLLPVRSAEDFGQQERPADALVDSERLAVRHRISGPFCL